MWIQRGTWCIHKGIVKCCEEFFALKAFTMRLSSCIILSVAIMSSVLQQGHVELKILSFYHQDTTKDINLKWCQKSYTGRYHVSDQ